MADPFEPSFGLSLDEMAVLEFTNDPELLRPTPRPAWRRKLYAKARRQGIILTTKKSYFWATLISDLVQRERISPPDQLLGAWFRAAKGSRGSLSESYSLISLRNEPSQEFIEQVLNELDPGVPTDRLETHARFAAESLQLKGLIEDPIELVVGGIAIAALGLIPIGWTRKTKEGRVLSEKINAMFWSYERTSAEGVETRRVEVQLFRMLKAFQAGAIGAFQDGIGENTSSKTSARRRPSGSAGS